MTVSGSARIVVGIDGSDNAKAALRWAAKQAGYTGAALDLVGAWEYPATYGWVAVPDQDYDLASYVQKAIDEAVADVFGDDVPATLSSRVIQGHAAEVLVDASKGAELLVVGSRGYGGFTDALLGSVSTYAVHHAHGAVTVVRP
jgi:nucleotide-binding universal stress UspA family protein